MNYLKNVFINFLIVFFADHILPGIQVVDQTKIPHIGGDLIFSLSLGLLNGVICPVFRLLRQEVNGLKIAMVALILNFGAYGIVKLLPLGITVMSVEGYLLAAVTVGLGSFITNFLEMKRTSHRMDIPK